MDVATLFVYYFRIRVLRGQVICSDIQIAVECSHLLLLPLRAGNGKSAREISF